MTLRGRLTLMSALIVGTILLIAAVVCFAVMRHELRSQIDDSLQAQASLLRTLPANPQRRFPDRPRRLPAPSARAGGAAPFVQFISAAGAVGDPARGELRMPVDKTDLALARRGGSPLLRDRHAHGVHLRLITVPVRGGGAVQLGRSLDSVDRALNRLRTLLVILVVGGLALAIGLSRLLARRVIAPIAALTAATQHIQATGDLGRRVTSDRRDEVGTLARRFNEMLDRLADTRAALEASMSSQRQLVADASHELRTPVTSLRTNIEMLLADPAMDDRARRNLLADVVEQTDELSAVVTDLIDLARGDQPQEHEEDLDLAAIAREAVDRARRHAPKLAFKAEIDAWPMTGSPERLGRALNNLLDNAAKFSPDGALIIVTLRSGTFAVRDHGPGIAPSELPHVFDRFYRGRTAAATHGSGLGLAIVKQVTEAHGGAVVAISPPDGGLLVELRFPATQGSSSPPATLAPSRSGA